MEIVIDINDEIYKEILNGKDGWSNYVHGLIRTGIPLPKGHGRLIDADEVNDAIHKCFEDIQFYDGTGYDIYSDSKESIDKISTIIEADKEK